MTKQITTMRHDGKQLAVIDSNSGRLDIPNESVPHLTNAQVSASLPVRILRNDPVGEEAN